MLAKIFSDFPFTKGEILKTSPLYQDQYPVPLPA